MAKLETATAWVNAEFKYLDDLLLALCTSYNEESGPGRRYRISNRTVMRFTPSVR
jgi:hypothetical protein